MRTSAVFVNDQLLQGKSSFPLPTCPQRMFAVHVDDPVTKGEYGTVIYSIVVTVYVKSDEAMYTDA